MKFPLTPCVGGAHENGELDHSPVSLTPGRPFKAALGFDTLWHFTLLILGKYIQMEQGSRWTGGLARFFFGISWKIYPASWAIFSQIPEIPNSNFQKCRFSRPS